MNARIIDMAGRKFASITAIKAVGKSSSGDLKWLFKCECGKQFEANGYYARSGKITTCPDCAAERVRLASVKHGLTNTAEFSVWTDIQTRCYNKSNKAFKHYGGRGITVCDQWLSSFESFLTDMGSRPNDDYSIERNDVNGNYEPGNCRWATAIEQANNKRSNLRVTIDGVTKPLKVWAKESQINYSNLWYRVKAGVIGRDLLAPSKRGNHSARKTYSEIRTS